MTAFLVLLSLILAACLVSTLLVVRAQHRGREWLRAYAQAHGLNQIITALDSADERAGRVMLQRLCDADKHGHPPIDELAFGRADARDTIGIVHGRGKAPTQPPPKQTRLVTPGDRTVRQDEHPGQDCSTAHPGVPHVALRPTRGTGGSGPLRP